MQFCGFLRKWKYRSTLEKCLIIIDLILILMLIILLISYLSQDPEKSVCTNPECIKASNHILDMIDVTVDPCEDFYMFTCGTFLRKVDNPRSSLTPLSELAKSQLRSIVMSPENSNCSKGVKLQRQFWRSCVNELDIEDDNSETFLSLLDEIGGWPLLARRPFDGNFDWIEAMLKSSKIGLDYDFFLSIKTTVDVNETEKNILLISPPYQQNLFKIEYPESTVETMKDIAKNLGASSLGVSADIRNVVKFAEEFNTIVNKAWNTSKDDPDDPIQNISMLNQKYMHKTWIALLNDLTDGIVKIEDNYLAMFKCEDYLRDLYYLLVRTDKRILANYVGWYQLYKNYNFLKKDLREKVKKAFNVKTNDLNKERKEECFWISRIFFPYVAEGGYIRKYMDKKRIDDIKKILHSIKEQFLMAFKYNEWMDDNTKKMLQERAKEISEGIGWTNMVYDEVKYEELLEIKMRKFKNSSLMMMTTELRRNDMVKLYGSLNKHQLDIHLQAEFPIIDINAYFIHVANILILPAPIIRGFIFDSERPNYLNYGALGSIIGHELTHSFAINTNLKDEYNYTWMTNQSEAIFNEKVRCVIEEYNEYLKDLNIEKVTNTSGEVDENVADITGQIMSYRSYQDFVQKYGSEPSLPGIHFTQNQVFWIMSSTYFCYNPNKPGELHSSKHHSDSRLRVLGALRNNPYFGEDFGCPVGSRMNPEKKCSIFT
ncbi:unnamed protein product [Brassicogethes aeneus]|uniref:Uncharacterized protein n=1 Tax=Brassicogethes aeneus TaxID=1431903 RepID=A0A9P0FF95_BRAAE|nr:unnamed protein product [Brassicogethes aeneus]